MGMITSHHEVNRCQAENAELPCGVVHVGPLPLWSVDSLASPLVLARWCPICGDQLKGKEQTCSNRCRQRKFRLNHKSRLEPEPKVIQPTLPGVWPETEVQRNLGK